MGHSGVRVSDLLVSLSLATDLGLGQPPEHMVRSAQIGLRLGQRLGGCMSTDRVVRVNSTTGETVEYLLPRPTNIRRVDVDNSTNPPTFWVGNNHGASIVKVEPLD